MVTSWDNFNGPTHNWVKLFVSIDNGLKWIVEDPKRESEVDSDILEHFCFFVK
jgi:hypothetical protein